MENLVNNNLQEMRDFVARTFKEECQIPTDLEEFKSGLTTETTDGSLCYAKQFGEGEDEVAMIFFYPTYCQVPMRYRDNMAIEGLTNMNMAILDYQEMLIKNNMIEDYDELQEMHIYMGLRFDNSVLSIGQYLFNQDNFRGDDKSDARKEIANYIEKYNEVNDLVVQKIKTFKQDNYAEAGEEE